MKQKGILCTVLCAAAVMLLFSGCTQPESSDSDKGGSSAGTELLGKGYDVFSEYAVSGTSVTDYQSELKGDIDVNGSYGLFSGEVKADFDFSGKTTSKTVYSTVQSKFNKHAYYLKSRTVPSDLKAYLDSTFKSRLNDNTYAAADLFKTYGTHCMVGVITGARLNYNMIAVSNSTTSKTAISAYATAKYSNLTAKSDISSDVTNGFDTSKTVTRTKAYGGKPEYAQSIHNSSDYTQWLDSIEGNEVFMAFYPTNSLIPIWEFCDTDTRKEAIKEAFDEYAESNQLSVTVSCGTLTIQPYKIQCDKSDDPNGGDGDVTVTISKGPST
jgi:hypothetical protein